MSVVGAQPGAKPAGFEPACAPQQGRLSNWLWLRHCFVTPHHPSRPHHSRPHPPLHRSTWLCAASWMPPATAAPVTRCSAWTGEAGQPPLVRAGCVVHARCARRVLPAVCLPDTARCCSGSLSSLLPRYCGSSPPASRCCPHFPCPQVHAAECLSHLSFLDLRSAGQPAPAGGW